MADSNMNMDENGEQESFDLKLSSSWFNDYVHLSIDPPDGVGIRAPCDICCVIDVSGSMSSEVTIQTGNKTERSGLSQLDIAKHALKTIINSLTENDRLSIVAFESKASTICPLKEMNDEGRTYATEQLAKLKPTGSTNLWDGLKTGLNTLSSDQRTSNCNVALFLLTDGEPTEVPTGGHIVALEQYKAEKNFTCSINTFGFGYSLDSQLLSDLAKIGNSGSYAFIPDGTFVGTVFVNAISNLLTTVATNLKLSIGNVQPAIDQSSIYISNYPKEISQHKFANEDGLCFNLGSLTFGQKQNLIIPMNREQYENFNVILDYETAFGEKKKQTTTIHKIQPNEQSFNQQKHRLELVNFIRQKHQYACQSTNSLANDDPNVFNDLQNLQQNIENHSTDDEYLTDLLKDLTGQVKEALSRADWFKKWGKHYLPSLANAHLFELCNNFKDPGVQHYGKGQLFDSIRDEMDSIFCGLPAPVPKVTGTYSYSTSTPIDMSAFNSCDNPCFHGSCTVKLLDGSIKFVKDVQRGDQLYPHGGTVTYVLQTMCQQNQSAMVLFDTGLMITPWHPIRLNAVQWVHPCSIHPATNMICQSVFSFALDKGHTVLVNDIECITLGHGFQQDIVRHRYYGTQRVIEDLRLLDSQQNSTGLIQIKTDAIQRNKRTGLVQRIQSTQLASNS